MPSGRPRRGRRAPPPSRFPKTVLRPLPAALRAAIDQAVAVLPASRLATAAAALTARYRAADRPAGPLIETGAERLAYLLVRLPATFAATAAVLSELAQRAPGLRPASLLDLGAGAGSAAWAAAEVFPDLGSAALIERDAAMIGLGRTLATDHPMLGRAVWQHAELSAASDLPAADLVVIAYALGELPEAAAESLLGRAWAAAGRALVVVEPGSRRGFATVRRARSALIATGATLAAPCPHALDCPLAEPDWCHFPVRFARGAAHRQAVGGSAGHDDEKYSYVAVLRDPAVARPATGRIVRAPMRRAGHVVLDVCTSGALARVTLSRRHGPAYRAARDSGWGGAWPPDGEPGESAAG